MRHIALGTASVLLLAMTACSGPAGETDTPNSTETTAQSETATPVADTEASTSKGVDALQLIKLDCGSIYVADLDIFSTAGDYAGETDTFSNTCWLVRHPEGNLLWDLGLPGILTSQDEQTTGVFTVWLEKTISQQMDELGLPMGDVDYVAISHSHFDHTGQADLLDDSLWLVNQMEYEYMFPAPEVAEVEPTEGDNEADGSDAASQFPGFEPLRHEIIADNHDVFGDGSVIIFMTPGHTPGHSSLLVNLPETGPVLLTGDLYHRAESRELKRVPQFNTSEETTLASMDAFEAKAAELGAKVIIQHEPTDTDDLPAVMR